VASTVRVVTLTLRGAAGGVEEAGVVDDPVDDAVMVKLVVAEVPPPGAGVITLIATMRGVVKSAAEMPARSCVALTNVVGRSVPSQRTLEVGTKLLPVTVSVSPPVPAAAVVGDRLLATGVGALMEKLKLPAEPPPGAGVTTLTGTRLGVIRSAVAIVVRS
jgi:hypothetical protein